MAARFVAIGRFGLGRCVLAQWGLGTPVWDVRGASPVAQAFFRAFFQEGV